MNARDKVLTETYFKFMISDYFIMANDPKYNALVRIARQANKLDLLDWLKETETGYDWDKFVNAELE